MRLWQGINTSQAIVHYAQWPWEMMHPKTSLRMGAVSQFHGDISQPRSQTAGNSWSLFLRGAICNVIFIWRAVLLKCGNWAVSSYAALQGTILYTFWKSKYLSMGNTMIPTESNRISAWFCHSWVWSFRNHFCICWFWGFSASIFASKALQMFCICKCIGLSSLQVFL